MKIVFLPWSQDRRYLQIVAEDMALRSRGQLGGLDLRATLLQPAYYQAFWDLCPSTRDKVREQVRKVVAEHAALRAIADRLMS
jgi:hypothetical protein